MCLCMGYIYIYICGSAYTQVHCVKLDIESVRVK